MNIMILFTIKKLNLIIESINEIAPNFRICQVFTTKPILCAYFESI